MSYFSTFDAEQGSPFESDLSASFYREKGAELDRHDIYNSKSKQQ
jgi:hypothetical protein